MNKTAIIVAGSLALAGIGAYFYFKPKASETRESMLENKISELNDGTPTSSISVPPKGTVLTTPEEVSETAQKIADAKAILLKLNDLRNQKRTLKNEPLTRGGRRVFGMVISENTEENKSKISQIDSQINDLENFMLNLGYTEANGTIVKIV